MIYLSLPDYQWWIGSSISIYPFWEVGTHMFLLGWYIGKFLIWHTLIQQIASGNICNKTPDSYLTFAKGTYGPYARKREKERKILESLVILALCLAPPQQACVRRKTGPACSFFHCPHHLESPQMEGNTSLCWAEGPCLTGNVFLNFHTTCGPKPNASQLFHHVLVWAPVE